MNEFVEAPLSELSPRVPEREVLPFTIEQIKSIEWTPHAKNPLIRSEIRDFSYLADPTFVTPGEAPDNQYHLFAPSGINLTEFTSKDGIVWDRKDREKPLVERGCRPFIYKDKDTYYLFYTKLDAFKPYKKYLKSHIEVMSSQDLQNWTTSKSILKPSDSRHKDVVGNPCIIKVDGKFRMYVSCGMNQISDCFFSEPSDIWYAESDTVDGNYTFHKEPIIKHDQSDNQINLGAGSIKVLRTNDGKYIGFQNCIYKKEKKT